LDGEGGDVLGRVRGKCLYFGFSGIFQNYMLSFLNAFFFSELYVLS